MQLLAPLVEDCRRHAALVAGIDGWRDCREALRSCFARLKAELLERRLALLDQELARLHAQVEKLTMQRDAQRRGVDDLKQAIRDNGGDRLEQLAAEIRQKESEQQRRRNKAGLHAALLARIGETEPGDEAEFLAQRHALGNRAEEMRTRVAELENQEREEDFTFRKGREEHAALSAEMDSSCAARATSMRRRYASAT